MTVVMDRYVAILYPVAQLADLVLDKFVNSAPETDLQIIREKAHPAALEIATIAALPTRVFPLCPSKPAHQRIVCIVTLGKHPTDRRIVKQPGEFCVIAIGNGLIGIECKKPFTRSL